MKKLIYLLFISLATTSYSQTCDCEKEFLFIQNYMEANYVGYADKVTDANKKEYNALKQKIQQETKTSTNNTYCLSRIKKYLDFFNDHHVQIIDKQQEVPNEKDTSVVNTILRKTEKITLSKELLKELEKRKVTDIEGVYNHTSGNYKIAIVKSKTATRDYAGIVIKARNKFWLPGMVKIELKQFNDSIYDGIMYNKQHIPISTTYTITNGIFSPDEFVKEGVKLPKDIYAEEVFEKEEKKGKFVFVKKLNDTTSYIRIRSFDAQFGAVIDSVIKANEPLLKSSPYMILDLRYNGGGSDGSYQPLLPYVYTNPVKNIGVDVYCTPANVIAQQRMLEKYGKYFSEDDKKEILGQIEKMKINSGKLISSAEDNIDTLKTIYPNPKKIAVLINGGCASTTEEFLLWARQSKKVTLIGEHTAGVLDYSNVREVDFPCLNYVLGYSTTRSRRIPTNSIDNVGIKPNVELLFGKDWLKKIAGILANK